ncbi:MAG: hypothetical protein J5I98_17785 [Phaeodactylibacter sp.]|nr:hypothetical protein [Phaeodactylibacter sp.]
MHASSDVPGSPKPSWPLHGRAGLALIILFWYLNWHLPGLRSHWAFFPLWLGYILTVDALVHYRRGSSWFTQNPKGFALLFLLSAPFWWVFEALNARTQYWVYIPIESFSDLEYYLYCTLNFSVVLPAILITSQLFQTFSWLRNLRPGWRVGKRPATVWLFFFLGWAMLAATLIWPQYGMAFIWMSLFFIMDPVNYWLGRPSLLRRTAEGDWRLVFALWLGGLTCGFFWELWNYYSSPKWLYQVPYVDFWYVFEMPLLGYLGYLPFALELYAMYAFFEGWLPGEGRTALRFAS